MATKDEDSLTIHAATLYICEGCETTLDDEPEGPAYECGSCGHNFSREMTDGGNHKCPECHKFGAKVGDYGCPECGAEMTVEYGIKCPHCDHAILMSEI